MKIKSGFLLVLSLVFGGLSLVSASGTLVQQAPSISAQIQDEIQKERSALRSYYQQSRDWVKTPFLNGEIRVQMQYLRDSLLNQLEAEIKVAKAQSKEKKKNLISAWSGAFAQIDSIDQNCLGWYHTMDLLSYAYDFPTALMIAVWRKESSCGYYLPKNGDGPFQIVSKDYSKITLTQESFEGMIQDFLLFSKNKISWYNKRNPDTPITLSYQELSQKDLLKFAALYNGLSGGTVYGDIQPAAPRYFRDKMQTDYADAKRNGLFAQVLRVLEREVMQ